MRQLLWGLLQNGWNGFGTNGCKFARNDIFFKRNDTVENRGDTCVYVDNLVDLAAFWKKRKKKRRKYDGEIL